MHVVAQVTWQRQQPRSRCDGIRSQRTTTFTTQHRQAPASLRRRVHTAALRRLVDEVTDSVDVLAVLL